MADLDRVEAEDAAARVLKERRMFDLPIDPMMIARAKGIAVESRPLESCSGCLIRTGNEFTICYSDRLRNEGFERFTVAHELGHYFLEGHVTALLPDGGIHESRSGLFDKNSRIERQADFFAAALLMPEHLVRDSIRKAKDCGFPLVEDLARACKTSITAAAIRYAAFAEDAVVVVLSKGRSVVATFLSEPLKNCGVRPLHKGSCIPPASATFQFNQRPGGGTTAQADGASMLDHWFDGAAPVDMSEDVVGLGSYGHTLTVLFTNEAVDDDAGEDAE